MKLSKNILTIALTTGLFIASPLFAGEGKSFEEKIIVETEPAKPWGVELSTGWDSLYMFRGVNVLRDGKGYGASLYWVDGFVEWDVTPNDMLMVGTWMAFGMDRKRYKELDVYAGYTRTVGDLAVNVGYNFYGVLSGPLYSHELNAGLAYKITLPAGITVVPSVAYFLNLGPDTGEQGLVEQWAGYLQARVDVGIPVYKDILALNPWVAMGASFDYNFREDGTAYTGANNLEIGVEVPVKVTEIVSVVVYGAYSTQWENLVGTSPNTFWGGARVVVAF